MFNSIRLVFVLGLLAAGCSLFSPSQDSLDQGGHCAPRTKPCSGHCVSTDEPATGCGSTSCEPCALDGAEAFCVGGQCRVGACDPGRADCDEAPANGCEAVLDSDAKNCGACGSSCALTGTQTSCVGGQCQVAKCDAGFEDCNGDSGDGCEAKLASDAKNCGVCGVVCEYPSAVPGCAEGACFVAGCVTGKGDCDGKPLNGCETDLATDSANCGACAEACSSAHATSSCSVGVCELTGCDEGWADCDGQAKNGCEAELATDANNCGACANAVGTGHVCRSGTATLDDPSLLAWLDAQKGGWCDDTFNKFINLCGTTSYCSWDYGTVYPGGVMFCCDPTFMRTYPNGIEIDLGFHWDGSSGGILGDFGGDGENKRIDCAIWSNELQCLGLGTSPKLATKLGSAGRFLMSYRVSATASELWLNGVLVDSGAGSGTTPELIAAYGPGMILGERISYWWEEVPPGDWLRHAPFFAHIQDAAPAPSTWVTADVIGKTQHSIVLFDSSGVSGDTWTDVVSGKVGLLCGGKEEAEKEGAAVIPCDGAKWVSDVSLQCL